MKSTVRGRLLLEPLMGVLCWLGVDTRNYIYDDDDPWFVPDDYISELAWLDRHMVCDSEGEVLRIL